MAALAQCASSPQFKQHYPAAAAKYLAKAQLGWQFLTNAIAKYGKAGAYQKITFYGDHYTHDDELAWAACEMFVATGNPYYQQTLFQWFPDPTSTSTFRWSWWRMSEGWGNAIRSYAFAARSGRLQPNQLDPNYLAKCITTITNAGNDALLWSQQGAYGSSFPMETKHVRSAGWYFSCAQAFDIVVAQQIAPRSEYIDALVRNMNYEGGCNPVNVTYVTGLGWKRQREIVDQYSQSDRRVLPKTGIPLGNIQNGFVWVNTYGTELAALCYPSDAATTAPVPFYDRWGDAFNTTTEFVVLDQARGLGVVAYLAALTSLKTQAWTSGAAQISAPTGVVPVGQPVTISLQSGLNLSGARIVWEGRDQEPAYGSTLHFHAGEQRRAMGRSRSSMAGWTPRFRDGELHGEQPERGLGGRRGADGRRARLRRRRFLELDQQQSGAVLGQPARINRPRRPDCTSIGSTMPRRRWTSAPATRCMPTFISTRRTRRPKSCSAGTTEAGSIARIGARTTLPTASAEPSAAVTWGRCRPPGNGCGSKSRPARSGWKAASSRAWTFRLMADA